MNLITWYLKEKIESERCGSCRSFFPPPLPMLRQRPQALAIEQGIELQIFSHFAEHIVIVKYPIKHDILQSVMKCNEDTEVIKMTIKRIFKSFHKKKC